jgi:hypothetical protein
MSVCEAVGTYLDEVLAANQQVAPYSSLSNLASPASVDEALCWFLVHLLGLPVADSGSAARRCLATYVEQDGRALANVLRTEPCWDAVQLEHMLVALHVGSRKNPRVLDPLRAFITGLNRHESIAVRSIARRICREQGWAWTEVNNMPPPTRLLIPTPITAQVDYNEARMLVGGSVAVAAELYRAVCAILARCGDDPDTLASEFARLYVQIEETYAWKDDARLQQQHHARAGMDAMPYESEYRKNKATFYGVSPPPRVRPLPATLLPLVPATGVGLPAYPGTRLARAGPAAPHASGGPALVAAGRPPEGRHERCQRAG